MTTPDDNLPPVQPPSAGFLMQLFVVPMVIVVVIIGVCLMFNWLAHMGTQPRDLVNDLNKLNPGSWQKALTIANLLTDSQQSALRQDAEMAQELADILSGQIDEANMQPERIKLRVYLCLALGVFEVDEGLPELIKAARTERDGVEREVRLTALEAIARRTQVGEQQRVSIQQSQELLDVLRSAANEFSDQPDQAKRDAQLRERVTFVYGVLGGKDSQDQLTRLLGDAHPTVRYNAATGLARHGDERAVSRLVEMLSNPVAHADAELDEFSRFTIIRNAMRATVQLIEANPNADVSELQQQIQRLSAEGNRAVAMDAKLTLAKLPK